MSLFRSGKDRDVSESVGGYQSFDWAGIKARCLRVKAGDETDVLCDSLVQ